MEKITSSYRIDPILKKEIKQILLFKNQDISDFIEECFKKLLEENKHLLLQTEEINNNLDLKENEKLEDIKITEENSNKLNVDDTNTQYK
jgi:hypothetical protein